MFSYKYNILYDYWHRGIPLLFNAIVQILSNSQEQNRVASIGRNLEWDGNSLNAGKGASALTEDKIVFTENCQL